MKRIPVRTCVGCRRTAAKADLTRLVLRGGALVPDPAGREPGRGAYVHPRPGCLQAALHGGLARSFRGRLSKAALSTVDFRLSTSSEGRNV